MRTLTLHTADELAVRWKRRAMEADASAGKGDEYDGYYAGLALGYRAAAAELQSLAAVSMELEAAHHGDLEPTILTDPPSCWCDANQPCSHQADAADPNALLDWSQGRRP